LRLFCTVESAVSDIIAVYCENCTVHAHTLFRQNAVSSVKTGGTYCYPCFLESCKKRTIIQVQQMQHSHPVIRIKWPLFLDFAMLKPIVYTNVTFLLPAVDLIEDINKCYEIYCLFLPIFVTSKTVNLSVIHSVSLRYSVL
jgi:hypothetical protein